MASQVRVEVSANPHGKCNTDIEETSRAESGSLEVTKDMKIEFNAAQTVFALFYAIMWGSLANVWPRWRAFDWTLIKRPEERALYRCLLSLALLNLCPIVFFIIVLLWLNDCTLQGCWLQIGWTLFVIMLQPFAEIGFYWFWISLVQWRAKWFYPDDVRDPRYEGRYKGLSKDDLSSEFAALNCVFGLVYVIVPFVLLLICPH